MTITDSYVLAEIKAKKEDKDKKEAEKQAWKVGQQARKVEWDQKKKEQEAAKAARKNEAQKKKEAREGAKEARKTKGHAKDKGNIMKAIEELTLSDQSDPESDAQCLKCRLTFQEDGSNSIWDVAIIVRPGWISTAQPYLIPMTFLKCISVVVVWCN